MNIGYLGPAGSHSHSAAEQFAQRVKSFGVAASLMPMTSLTVILDAVDEGAMDMAVIPVENALEGSVAEVLDGLAGQFASTMVAAEFVRPIHHALIRKYEFVEGIRFVHSHAQAIAQCRQGIYDLLGKEVKLISESSTSEAVKGLATLDEAHAAIGTLEAAHHYGMEVVVEDISDADHNATRFWVVSAKAGPWPWLREPEAAVKTSLCVALHENKPGALLAILMILAQFGLNMSKIESRPSKRALGQYVFYLDIEGALPDTVADIIGENTSWFRLLGEYPTLTL